MKGFRSNRLVGGAVAAWLSAAVLALSRGEDGLIEYQLVSPVAVEHETVDEGETAFAVGFAEPGDLQLATFQDARPLPPSLARPTGPISPAVGPGFQPVIAGLSSSFARPTGELRIAPGGRTLTASYLDANARITTDLGDLLGKTMSSLGVPTQSRNPTVNENRPNGTQQAQANVGGSYWFPARQDLDTAVSKIDSQLVDHVLVIRGPYSARYGPGFSFIDFQLLRSPRYDSPAAFGSTSLDYRSNGQQWHGRQTASIGSSDWGAEFGYTHRTGNDYTTGDGFEIPSSFNSREANAMIGWDPTPDSSVEFSYIRLDQTNMELPGQAFDIEYLVTDAWELMYQARDVPIGDFFEIEGWYNRTRFAGDAQRPGKRRQVVVLDDVNFFGTTDADGASMGYTTALTFGDSARDNLSVGTDLRVLKQNINEVNRFDMLVPTGNEIFGLDVYDRVLSPLIDKTVPKSEAVNPGLFLEGIAQVSDDISIRVGGRYDRWTTEVTDLDPIQRVLPGPLTIGINPEFGIVPIVTPQFGDVVIPAEFLPDRDFNLPSGYVSADYRPFEEVTITAGAGAATRAPTLTELYAMNGPFLAVLQRGGNFVFGNSQLQTEKLWQVDLGVRADFGPVRAGVGGFHAWIEDYITYRPLLPIYAIPSIGVGLPINVDDPLQIPFQAVEFTNTDLATLAGTQGFLEVDVVDWLTVFGMLSYIQGTDQTREQSGTSPPELIAPELIDLVGPIDVPDTEPLPGIAPLESRLGFRIHEPQIDSPWEVEISARVVDRQSRVARTVLEQVTPGFTTWDARAYWRRTEQHLVVAGVENFTDRFYREHLDLRTGVFQPRISFYLGSQLYY